jgi:hypothetical protein
MFDTYSELPSDARTVAFFHPGTQTTWPDMVRQSCSEDIEVHLHRACSESHLHGFAAGFIAPFSRWQLNLLRWPVRKVQVHEEYSLLKRHFPVHR